MAQVAHSSSSEETQAQNTPSLLGMTMTALRIGAEGVKNILSLGSDVTLFTLKEVQDHDSFDDCWVVIYDHVYDVTKFLELHPGGDELLMEYAGRDASLAFRGTGHSVDAHNMLKPYKVGELVPEDRIFRCESRLSFTSIPESFQT